MRLPVGTKVVLPSSLRAVPGARAGRRFCTCCAHAPPLAECPLLQQWLGDPAPPINLTDGTSALKPTAPGWHWVRWLERPATTCGFTNSTLRTGVVALFQGPLHLAPGLTFSVSVIHISQMNEI